MYHTVPGNQALMCFTQLCCDRLGLNQVLRAGVSGVAWVDMGLFYELWIKDCVKNNADNLLYDPILELWYSKVSKKHRWLRYVHSASDPPLKTSLENRKLQCL